MCLVEAEKCLLQTACTLVATEGMTRTVTAASARDARKYMLNFC